MWWRAARVAPGWGVLEGGQYRSGRVDRVAAGRVQGVMSVCVAGQVCEMIATVAE